MSLVQLNSIEPPWYGPVCPVVWEGRHREVSPYPDQSAITSLAGLFSVTGVYTIAATGLGVALLTTHVEATAIPIVEPASVALLGGILLGFGAFQRLREDM